MEEILDFIRGFHALPFDELKVSAYGYSVTVKYDGSCRIDDFIVVRNSMFEKKL